MRNVEFPETEIQRIKIGCEQEEKDRMLYDKNLNREQGEYERKEDQTKEQIDVE